MLNATYTDVAGTPIIKISIDAVQFNFQYTAMENYMIYIITAVFVIVASRSHIKHEVVSVRKKSTTITG